MNFVRNLPLKMEVKIFENLPATGEVMSKSIVALFFASRCICVMPISCSNRVFRVQDIVCARDFLLQ